MTQPNASYVSHPACHDAIRLRIFPNRPATIGLTRYCLLTTVALWCQPCALLSRDPVSWEYADAVHVQTLGFHASPHDAPAGALARPRTAPMPDQLNAAPRWEG
jgi:hypothetical protein